MMGRMVEAIYEKGMLKLLGTVDLSEHQHARITIHESLDESPEEALKA